MWKIEDLRSSDLHVKRELLHLERLAVFKIVCFFRRKKTQGKAKNRQKLNGQILVIGYEEGVEFLNFVLSLAADLFLHFQSLLCFSSSLICYTSIGEGYGYYRSEHCENLMTLLGWWVTTMELILCSFFSSPGFLKIGKPLEITGSVGWEVNFSWELRNIEGF